MSEKNELEEDLVFGSGLMADDFADDQRSDFGTRCFVEFDYEGNFSIYDAEECLVEICHENEETGEFFAKRVVLSNEDADELCTTGGFWQGKEITGVRVSNLLKYDGTHEIV